MTYDVKMYGRSVGCKYCTTAKEICISNNFNLDFVDIEKENITGEQLREITGNPSVRTVPQIFVDGNYIGGCDEFIKFLKGE